jgi:hypothetical protein
VGIASVLVPASALGTSTTIVGTDSQQAATLVHELGTTSAFTTAAPTTSTDELSVHVLGHHARGGHRLLALGGAIVIGTNMILDTTPTGDDVFGFFFLNGVMTFSVRPITPDVQFVSHPAYNQDRGPVWVFGGRLRGEY